MKDLNGFPSGRMVWEVLCTTIFGNEKKGEVKTISFNFESLELTTRLKEIKKINIPVVTLNRIQKFL